MKQLRYTFVALLATFSMACIFNACSENEELDSIKTSSLKVIVGERVFMPFSVHGTVSSYDKEELQLMRTKYLTMVDDTSDIPDSTIVNTVYFLDKKTAKLFGNEFSFAITGMVNYYHGEYITPSYSMGGAIEYTKYRDDYVYDSEVFSYNVNAKYHTYSISFIVYQYRSFADLMNGASIGSQSVSFSDTWSGDSIASAKVIIK